MMSLEDVAYYRSRALQERKLAEEATSPEAAQAHEELAQLYEGLVAHADMLPQERTPSIQLKDGVARNDHSAGRDSPA